MIAIKFTNKEARILLDSLVKTGADYGIPNGSWEEQYKRMSGTKEDLIEGRVLDKLTKALTKALKMNIGDYVLTQFGTGYITKQFSTHVVVKIDGQDFNLWFGKDEVIKVL